MENSCRGALASTSGCTKRTAKTWTQPRCSGQSPNRRTRSRNPPRYRRSRAGPSRLPRWKSPAPASSRRPEEVAETTITGSPMLVETTRRPADDHKAVTRVVDLIAARNPILLAGNGAVRKRATKQLRCRAHKVGIGVASCSLARARYHSMAPLLIRHRLAFRRDEAAGAERHTGCSGAGGKRSKHRTCIAHPRERIYRLA